MNASQAEGLIALLIAQKYFLLLDQLWQELTVRF